MKLNKQTKHSIRILYLFIAVVAVIGFLAQRGTKADAEAQIYKSQLDGKDQKIEQLIKEKTEAEVKLKAKQEVEETIAKAPLPKARALKAALNEWGVEHINAFVELINRESGFNPLAKNPASSACGIFQSYPCEKMKCELWDIDCQIAWGVKYIKSRYQTPTNALNFWLAQKKTTGKGWY